MAKDPAFLFYPGDWLGGTIGMTLEEKGAYMELLMMQFTRGHMTSHMIGQTVGHLWDKVKDKFVQDDDGLWYNVRLDIEKDKRKKFTESRRNNVSGKNQHDKPKVIYNGHMTSHMENRNENVFSNNKEAFDEISKNYKEAESHLNILHNHGWQTATENDCKALLYHFLESQVDIERQPKHDIKSHFRRWRNKVPKNELQTLAIKIRERR
jgi:uncharacterized protein YdaU (DUF1376 family)